MNADDENKMLRAQVELAELVLGKIAELHKQVRGDAFNFPLEIQALATLGINMSANAQQCLNQMHQMRRTST